MKNARVLVIEDEMLVALDVVWTLEKAGFAAVEHAATETDALARIEDGTWNVVVADANLNGVGIGRIVERLQHKALPFVVVTGYGRERLPEFVGNAPVLDKPLSHHELVRVLKRICKSKAPEALSTPTPA